MIEIKNASFQYYTSSNFSLKNISIEITEGEIVGIIGPTGSGKSTFCYLLNGLIPHSIKGYFDGEVLVNGKNTRDESIAELSKIVGYMLQEPSFQIITPNVESEIAFGMENMGLSRDEMQERIDNICKILGIEHLRKRATSNLSEGEKQRIILASVMILQPDILVLDECTSMLDIPSKQELATTLKKLNTEQNKTIIMIEHDLDFLLELTDRIILINNGLIAADGAMSKILTDIKLLVNNSLVPPKLIELFASFAENNLPVKKMPGTYKEAKEIMKEWLL